MYHTVILLLEFCWYRRATGQPVGRQWHHTGSELVGRPHHTSLWWSERNIAQHVCGLSLSLIFLGLCAYATYRTTTEKVPVGREAHTRTNRSSVTIYHNIISKVYTSTSTTIDVATTIGAIVSALYRSVFACHMVAYFRIACAQDTLSMILMAAPFLLLNATAATLSLPKIWRNISGC